jgi:acylphosphatase
VTATVVRVTITGRVQGVGFRVWLRDSATDAGVAGWVRNRRDGAVECLLAGDADAVRALIERCRIGPPGAGVAAIATAAATEPATLGFAIRDA